ncbi:hypothetical protein [Cohnella hongkongensis]|uniref:DUF4179 domain-containing protein n=1 Tax=Cohnella hongkongensis TaxID=178337 RepID=A0ABV9FJP6_9BACL
MKDADWERWLGQALASEAKPDDKLNMSILHRMRMRHQTKPKSVTKLSAALLAAVFLLVLSVSAYAATQLFGAREVAERLGDRLLAEAFDSDNAIRLDQSVASGDYRFTLHGLVSGAGLSEFPSSSEELYPDRTYAVVSIARQDGRPMPDTRDPEYGQDPFFVSPLIKGQKPWSVNIITMNGHYSETVIDGVAYRLLACDQVEIFADRGVYLAISSGSPFYSREAFDYDENTGESRAREDYPGASALFDLPLDRTKADPAKAEAYLEALLNPSASPAADNGERIADAEDEAWVDWIAELRTRMRSGGTIGETIADSIQEVTYDDSGHFRYSYDDWSVEAAPEDFFREGQVGFSDRFSGSGKDGRYRALLFHRDEHGVITGRIVLLENHPE